MLSISSISFPYNSTGKVFSNIRKAIFASSALFAHASSTSERLKYMSSKISRSSLSRCARSSRYSVSACSFRARSSAGSSASGEIVVFPSILHSMTSGRFHVPREMRGHPFLCHTETAFRFTPNILHRSVVETMNCSFPSTTAPPGETNRVTTLYLVTLNFQFFTQPSAAPCPTPAISASLSTFF